MKKDIAYELFNDVIFPEFLNNLKNEDSQKKYIAVKNKIESLCDKPFLHLTKEDGKLYCKFLLSKYAYTTTCVRLSMLISLGNFCENTSLTDETSFTSYTNPFFDIKKNLKNPYYIDENTIPSPKELNDFLANCNESIRLVTTLIVKCGLTPTDLIHLKFSALKKNEERTYISLFKDGYERYVMLPEDALLMIIAYITNNGLNNQNFIFCNTRNKPLSLRTLERWYKKECELYDFHYTMQDLRNASAAFMLAGGASKKNVTELLGISKKWNDRFDRCQDRIASFDASEYSVINLKPYAFKKQN